MCFICVNRYVFHNFETYNRILMKFRAPLIKKWVVFNDRRILRIVNEAVSTAAGMERLMG
jgi:hypothetical protein